MSADGNVAGCSRPAIGILCGITSQSITKLIDTCSQELPPTSEIPKSLKALLEQPFYPQLEGTNGAKILKEEACVAIIEYYAYLSPYKSDVAVFSYRKFVAMGWHNWVLAITGHKAKQDVDMGVNYAYSRNSVFTRVVAVYL